MTDDDVDIINKILDKITDLKVFWIESMLLKKQMSKTFFVLSPQPITDTGLTDKMFAALAPHLIRFRITNIALLRKTQFIALNDFASS